MATVQTARRGRRSKRRAGQARLPLRYDGAAFSIVASHVERGAELGIHAFDLTAALSKVAAGDRAGLLRLVVVDGFPSLSAAPPNEGQHEGRHHGQLEV